MAVFYEEVCKLEALIKKGEDQQLMLNFMIYQYAIQVVQWEAQLSISEFCDALLIMEEDAMKFAEEEHAMNLAQSEAQASISELLDAMLIMDEDAVALKQYNKKHRIRGGRKKQAAKKREQERGKRLLQSVIQGANKHVHCSVRNQRCK